MAFKSLEQRFNERVNELYAGATNKFDGGKTSTGRNDDPLIVRAPGKGYWTFAEGRSLPVQSSINDVKRLTLFTLSQRGILFLAKQQLLQTGNTFEQTRLINPLFVIGNAVPFIHVRRHLRPVKNLVGKTDTSHANVKKLGQLQVGTYNTAKKWEMPQYIKEHLALSAQSTGTEQKPQSLLKSFLNKVGSKLQSTLASAVSPITNTISAVTAPKNIGEREPWENSRPEISTVFNKAVDASNAIYQSRTREWFEALPNGDSVDRVPFVKYFTSPDGVSTLNATEARSNQISVNAKTIAESKKSTTPGVKISYIKDPANAKQSVAEFSTAVLQPYQAINNSFDDPITVSFAMASKAHVKFRAFIKDLTQNITPQYKDYQYIGRVDKFITYTGVQRDIQFKLGVIAFSKDELDIVWRRINYLTGLVYPSGFYQGIFQPNIVRLTIGNVYRDQPGYITSLETNFNDITETWDIDSQVPIAATMNIRYTIIEKASRIADSPFYAATEPGPPAGFASDRFSQTIIPDLETSIAAGAVASKNLESRGIPTVGITSNGNTLTPTGQITPRLPSAPRLPTLPIGRDELLNINLRG